jgi:ribosomal-protein-alanine N-acetyltransferase
VLTFNFNPFPELTTERLVLRQITVADVNEIFRLRSEEEVLRYIKKAPAKDHEDALKWIQLISDQGEAELSITWALTLKGDQEMIGTICIWNIQKSQYRGELGYSLLPEHHRKGYMNEAIEAVMKYAFEKMKLHGVEAHIDPDNQGSLRLMEKQKFMKEGHLKENYFYDGEFFDTVIFGKLSHIPFSK